MTIMHFYSYKRYKQCTGDGISERSIHQPLALRVLESITSTVLHLRRRVKDIL